VDVQTGLFSLSFDGIDEHIHADVISKKIFHCQVQQAQFRTHMCIVFWGLVRHIAHSPLVRDKKTIKMIILVGPVCRSCVHAHCALTGGEDS